MVIKISEVAMNKLQEVASQEKLVPRIDADVAGGCGLSVKFSIVWDEPRRNDTIIEYEGIQIRLDHFTKRYLDQETQIDYQDEQGFIVGDQFTSSACSIEIIR